MCGAAGSVGGEQQDSFRAESSVIHSSDQQIRATLHPPSPQTPGPQPQVAELPDTTTGPENYQSNGPGGVGQRHRRRPPTQRHQNRQRNRPKQTRCPAKTRGIRKKDRMGSRRFERREEFERN
ncbi:unnamed protein product [Rhodiola kirilowii]